MPFYVLTSLMVDGVDLNVVRFVFLLSFALDLREKAAVIIDPGSWLI